jgi:hypothetical protein
VNAGGGHSLCTAQISERVCGERHEFPFYDLSHFLKNESHIVAVLVGIIKTIERNPETKSTSTAGHKKSVFYVV